MKTWLITGASSGLGRLMCETLLARGDRVFASVRNRAVLDDLAATYGDHLQVMMLDLSRSAVKPSSTVGFLFPMNSRKISGNINDFFNSADQ